MHVTTHGAAAGPRNGHRGLIAGCAFAKDIPKAFLAHPLRQCPTGRPRDYVDDITLQITEAEPGLCAMRMEESLRDLTVAFDADNMELNPGKQQVLGLTRAAREAWESRGIRYYGHGHSHPELSKNIESLQAPATRIGSTEGTRASRCKISGGGGIPSGKCLYGAECHYITEWQFVRTRRAMCTAMGDKEGRRPAAVRLLVVGAGKWGPEVVRAKRIVKHWHKEAAKYCITDEYWETLAGTARKLGPFTEASHPREGRRRLQRMGLLGGIWTSSSAVHRPERGYNPRRGSHRIEMAKTRQAQVGSAGLHEDRDEEVMLLVDRARRSPVLKGILCNIQSHSVYTPSRAHLRWGFDAGCPLCGAPIGTWQHFIDDCAGTRRPP